ncbi:MAG: glutamate--tRNA ligase [Candidatus Anstonellaceae archaeon]
MTIEDLLKDKKLMDEIKKQCLKNAKEYGKADAKRLIGKIISKFPDKKNNVKEILEILELETERINKLNKEELEKEISYYKVDIKEEKEKAKEEVRKIVLPNAEEGKVITRFAPEPGGYLHIGHAKAICLEYFSALEYNGKMLLRFDDTNPQKAEWIYVEEIKKELDWLGIKPFSTSYSSDYMEKFYFYGNELIKNNKAYVCTCSQEEIKNNRIKRKRCKCFSKKVSMELEKFQKMIKGEYEEGEAVLRFVGEMDSENTTLHDPTLFRIIKAQHYKEKNKYCCWPTYDFAAPILDSIEGITHAMRSKEYELRDELYYNILDSLKLRKPIVVSFSRLSIKGMPVSKRLITPLIKQKKVEGYDDPRLPTLAALRRRGIRPEAIKEFVLSFGLTKVESEPGLDKLLVINKKMIDPQTKRRFFVPFPAARLKLNLLPQKIKIKNHPTSSLGEREIKIGDEEIIYVPRKDIEDLKIGEKFRLKDFCSVEITKKQMNDETIVLEGKKITEPKNLEEQKKLQWVIENQKVFVQVLIPTELYIGEEFNKNSLTIIEGVSEKECLNDEIGETYQFERFGFVVLDKKEKNKLTYIFICK